MRPGLKSFIGSSSASAAIEFAFIAPIMLLMMAGVVEISRLYQVYSATNRLATQYAIVYADCNDTTSGGMCGTELSALGSTNSFANIVPQLQTSLLSVTIFQVDMSGTTPTVRYAYPSGSSMTASQISAAQGVLQSGQVGVIVTATYNHTLQFFQTIMNQYLSTLLTVSYTAVQLKA